MRFFSKDLKGLPVETRSGLSVGKVIDIVFETSEHRVVQYRVKKAHALAKILPAELLIDCGQVVSITTERMIVDDGIIGSKEEERERIIVSQGTTANAQAPVTRTAEGTE